MWNSSSVLYFFWHWHFWVICQLFWRMSLGSDLSDYSLMISFRSCVLTEPPPGWSCVLLSAHYQAAPDVKVASTGFSRFPAGAVIKSPPANAEDARDVGLIPGSGRSPGAGNGNPFQCSCLENPMARRALAAYTPQGCKESGETECRQTRFLHSNVIVFPFVGCEKIPLHCANINFHPKVR